MNITISMPLLWLITITGFTYIRTYVWISILILVSHRIIEKHINSYNKRILSDLQFFSHNTT